MAAIPLFTITTVRIRAEGVRLLGRGGTVPGLDGSLGHSMDDTMKQTKHFKQKSQSSEHETVNFCSTFTHHCTDGE